MTCKLCRVGLPSGVTVLADSNDCARRPVEVAAPRWSNCQAWCPSLSVREPTKVARIRGFRRLRPVLPILSPAIAG
jgi:hypothetical protein